MEVIKAIYERRAVRQYTGQQVPRLALLNLIEAAIQAPSAVNQQPWAFSVFQGRDRLKSYSDQAKQHFLAMFTSAPGLSEEVTRMLQDPGYNIFYNADAVVVIWAKSGGLNPAEDCCLAAQNLMLAAHASGLGSCPIGFARPWLNLPEVKQELAIPEEYSAVFPVIVGWPMETPAHPPRNNPKILSWLSTHSQDSRG